MATFVKSSDDPQNVFGNWRTVVGTYTGPTSYVTGGDTITPSTFVLSDIRYLVLGTAFNGTNAYTLILNTTKTKIIWFDSGSGTEVAAGTALNAFNSFVLAIGR